MLLHRKLLVCPIQFSKFTNHQAKVVLFTTSCYPLRNCPAHPIVVQKSPNGVLLPVNFTQPIAVDNSGSIARTDVKPEDFSLPLTTCEDMMVEYFAYDYGGNVAICQVNITVLDDTPPFLECPQSFVLELIEEKSEYPVNFKQLRALVNTSDPSGEVIVVTTGTKPRS